MAFRYWRLFLLILLTGVGFTVKAQNAKTMLLKKVTGIPIPPVGEYLSLSYIVNEQPEIIAVTRWEGFEGNIKANAIIASKMGKGKVLMLGSSAYLKPGMLQNKNVAQLLTNTLGWAGAGKKNITVALTLNAGNKALSSLLTRQHASAYTIKNFAFKSHTDVLILNEDVPNPAHQKKIETFISNGGTLIFASPFGDIYNKRDSTRSLKIVQLAFNKVLARAGIFNTYQLVEQTATNKTLVTDSIPDYLHISTILPRLLQRHQTNQDNLIDYAFTDPTLELVFANNDINSPVIKHMKAYFNIPDVLPVPSPAKPIANNTPKLKAATKIGYMLYAKQHDFENHPTAKAPGYDVFPGAMPDTAIRVNQTVDIPVMVGTQGLNEMPSVYFRPHSTGLYVPAGEKVTVTINPADIKQSLKVQIGVHDDNGSNLNEYKRVPVNMVKIFSLDKEKTEIYSPYGGLLLIGIADTSKLKNIKINVTGAVKAPYFKLGETSEQDWISTIRNNPAPWAELATDKIVFTVPSYRIRNLNNPVKLLQFWDEVMDADADLAIIARKRAHQERVIVDVDVAWGYMFTEPYKIVAPDNDETCAHMLNEAFVRANGLWGVFHEIGHRHQFFDLDFPGTTEVTVNLYTMYVFDKVLHQGIYRHEDMTSKAEVIQKIKAYLADKPSYEKWCNDPFLALSMYIQIIDAFGWDAIKAANTTYRNLPADQYPKTDQDKRDLWFTTICKATNSNLARFFGTWKIEVSDVAKKQAAGYREWYPKELE